MKKYFKLLRVEQWVKNLFVFVPLFFSGNIQNIDLLSKSIFAFIIFSLAASVVYILNDYNDIEADRKHPEKRRRPLASGAVSKSQAIAIFAEKSLEICHHHRLLFCYESCLHIQVEACSYH